MKRTYEVRDRADKRAIREFLKREGVQPTLMVYTMAYTDG